LDRLQGHSRALERAPESQIRGPLTLIAKQRAVGFILAWSLASLQVGLKEKAEELVRIANIINNTMADAETGILLAGEGYYIDIATQFFEVAETLRLILYNALP